MSNIRKTNTSPELIIRSFLFKKGLRFRIHVKKLPGNPDIVLPKYRTIVMVNGCFWHAHEGCKLNKFPKSRQEYWIPKILKNVERDKQNIITLQQEGWEVITVWECELKKGKIETTLDRIYNEILK